MLKKLGFKTVDVVLFLLFALVYAGFGAAWTLGLVPGFTPDSSTVLQDNKDLMYAALWITAAGYAILANSIALIRNGSKPGIIGFPITLFVMLVIFVAMTALTMLLQNTIKSSVKILSISVTDLLVLLPVVTASICFIVAWIAAGVTNHLRLQPITQGFIRIGVALMTFPLIQFLLIVFLPHWEDEVRGVVFVHAMGLGLLWGLFLGGAVGSNLRKPSTETVRDAA